jgi:hypothetical protein
MKIARTEKDVAEEDLSLSRRLGAVGPFFALAAGALAWLPLSAYDAPPERRVELGAWTDHAYRFAANLDGAPGRIALSQDKLSLDAVFPSRDYDTLRVSGSLEFMRYDFSDGAALTPGAQGLFEDVVVARTDATYLRALDEQWMGIASATLATAYEEGAEARDGLASAGRLGGLRRFSDDLTLGLALYVQGRIEDAPYYFPYPLVDWTIAPGWALKTEQKAGFGYVLEKTLGETQAWAVETRLRYTSRRFRLGRGPVVPEGVVEDERGMVDVGLRGPLGGGITFHVYAGVDVWQSFTVEDRRGDSRDEVESSPSPFVGISVQGRF